MPPAERDASPYRERFGARAVPHWMTTDATAVAPQSLNAGSMHSNNEFAAVLFDMEGTILISIGIAERIWAWWAESRGIDPAVLLPTIHGVRAVETISRLDLPGIDAEAEADRITQAEIAAMDGIEPIPGVAAFIGSLPTDRWAVVTSAPRALAERRIEAAGLPMPAILIAAEDVAISKPAQTTICSPPRVWVSWRPRASCSRTLPQASQPQKRPARRSFSSPHIRSARSPSVILPRRASTDCASG